MATFIKDGDDDSFECCPYNAAHRIKRSRFHTHIIKCRENYQTDKQVCPFNARHYISKSEFQKHLSTCPDKEAVDKRVAEMSKETLFKGRTAVPSYFGFKIPEEENWDHVNNDNESHHLQDEARTISSLNTDNSYDLKREKFSYNQDMPENQQICEKLNKEDAEFEEQAKFVGTSQETLLGRTLQSVKQSRGICFGRGRGTFLGVNGTSVDKFSIPKNSVGIGRGIISSKFNASSAKNSSLEANDTDISEKIKDLINSLPPCEPGEIRNISGTKLQRR